MYKTTLFMKLRYQILLGLLYGLFVCDVVQAQPISVSKAGEGSSTVVSDTLLFRFVPGKQMFWADYKGNKESIESMSHLIRTNRSDIESGGIKVRILGFCSSYGSVKENLAVAKNRSNQVKSYFIVHEGLKEEHFRTSNSTRRWRGLRDVIAVAYLFDVDHSGRLVLPDRRSDTTLTVEPVVEEESSAPAKEGDSTTESMTPSVEPATAATTHIDEGASVSDPLATSETPLDKRVEPIEPMEPKSVESIPTVSDEEPSYRWAVKTNVAYLAATVANLGIEYSFGERYSIDLPVIYSPYTVSRDFRLSFLAVQPEFRYWLRKPLQGHFFGVHLNMGAFNVAVNSDIRYQSPDGFYGVGISYGYVLPIARHWAAEFTLGAGYVYTKYDSYYNIPNGARVERGVRYNYWGLTKVGISLSYRFGK